MEQVLRAGAASQNVVRYTDSHFQAVNVLKAFSAVPDQPVAAGRGRILVDGTLFHENSTGLDALREGLASLDPSSLLRLNGQFNAVHYDPQNKKLVILTDRMGSRPLYHYAGGTRHGIASEMKAVLAATGEMPDLDPLGLLEFLTFGHNVGQRTVLEGIHVLPPGSAMTILEGGVDTRRYFQYRYRPDKDPSGPAVLGRRIAERVQAVVPRYLDGPGRKVLLLTGGLDSRILAAAIHGAGRSVPAFTFGDAGSRDVRFAASLSARLGFEHHALAYPDVYLSGVIRDVVARTECAAPFHHATSILFHDRMAQEADVLLTGFCGDTFSGGHLKSSLFRAGPGPGLTRRLFERASCASLKDLARIFRPEALERLWPEFQEAFRSSVEAIPDRTGPDVADVWDVVHRQRRFTFSAPKVDRCRFEVLSPLVDNDILDLVLGLPEEARKNQLAYRHALVTGFPEIRSVPWTDTGRTVKVHPLGILADEALCKATGVIRRARTALGLGHPAPAWQFRDVGESMRRDEALFKTHLIPFLESDLFHGDLLNAQGIRDLVEAHGRGAVDASHLLGALLTLAVFLDLCKEWTRGS